MGQKLSYSAACDQLEEELGIRGPFLGSRDAGTSISLQRVVCLMQQKWLANQMNSREVQPQNCSSGEPLTSEEKTGLLQPSSQHELNGWQRFTVIVIKKPLKKIRISERVSKEAESYGMFDFLLHVAAKDKADSTDDLNRKFSKKESGKERSFAHLDKDILATYLEEAYGVKMKFIGKEAPTQSSLNQFQCEDSESCSNTFLPSNELHFVPLLLACESDGFMYFVEATPTYTLHDVLAFSPAVASNSAAKYMFLFYQVLKIFSAVKASGFKISTSITFKDLYVRNSMWLSISRFLVDDSDVVLQGDDEQISSLDSWLIETPRLLTPPFICVENLQSYTTKWVNCQLTTFDYLMILNTLAGRRMKDPSHYPIFPWVVDFSKADGGFRDFTKSKFRLCKSDAQLDITYSPLVGSWKDAVGSIAHHISDGPLSAITYFVYVSRRVPKEMLCNHVRARWVPDEYPSSIERLYSWTPEECIPEFYSDPSIFRSIHPDLPDLKIPSWSESPEEFIRYHRSVLESQFVSQNLNHWIDLVFGYKLSGTASIDSKNVYLSLVDGHSYLTNCGVLQLFSRPHPARRVLDRRCEEPIKSTKSDSFSENIDSDVLCSGAKGTDANDIACVNGKVLEDDVKIRRPKAIRRDIWSIDSAIDEASQIEEPPKGDEAEAETRHKGSVTLLPSGLKMRIDNLLEGAGYESRTLIGDDIKIDSDGLSNFLADLEAVEKEVKFQCHLAPADSNGVGSFPFGSILDSKKQEKAGNNVHLHPPSRNEILTLTNILIELALHEYVRLRTRKLDIRERLEENKRLMKANLHRFPSWLFAVLEMWSSEQLSTDDANDDVTVNKFFKDTDVLLSRFSNPFPHPKYFPSLHNLLTILFKGIGSVHDSSTVVDRYNLNAMKSGEPVPTVSNIIRAAHLLPFLIEELDSEGIYLLLSFLLPLFSNPDTKLYAFLHFLHPLGEVMGFQSSFRHFFVDLQKLYDIGSDLYLVESKLLDQNFISKVITVFGLRCFLGCFMQYVIDGLVEKNGIGSSKEKNDSDNFDTESSESRKPSGTFKEGTSDGDNISLGSRERFENERQMSNEDGNQDRKSTASFIDDEDNVNLFDPKVLSGKRLARSGVFTRLESVLEVDLKKDRITSDESSTSDDQDVSEIIAKDVSTELADSSTIADKKDGGDGQRFLKVVDKSEVIYSENGDDKLFADSSHVGSDQLKMARVPSLESDSSNPFSSSGAKVFGADSRDNCSSPEGFVLTKRRSTLSESVQNSSSVQSEDKNSKPSVDSNCTGNTHGSTDDDLPVNIEDFSIDSMCSEDDGKSFLIRRSNMKVRSQSGSSPFMVLHSDEDASDRDEEIEELADKNGFEHCADLTIDRIPDVGVLADMDKSNDETVQLDASAEELSLGSLKWIMPWLGPALTSKYVVNLILKKIPKIWLSVKNEERSTEDVIGAFCSKGRHLLDCLVEVVEIYGRAVVYHQFIPFASWAVAAALKSSSVSAYVEGQLVSGTQILAKALAKLSPGDLAVKVEVLSQDVFEPLLRLLSSFKPFTSGWLVRSVLLHSLVDLLAKLSQRLGQLDARDVMTPLLQRFFSCFDCVYRLERKDDSSSLVVRKYSLFATDDDDEDATDRAEGIPTTLDDELVASVSEVPVKTDGDLGMQDLPCDDEAESGKNIASCGNRDAVQTERGKEANGDKLGIQKKQESMGSDGTGVKQLNGKAKKEMIQYKDLYESFTPDLAHYSYVLFCRVLGDHFVADILYNADLIWQLCSFVDEGLTLTGNNETVVRSDSGKQKEEEKLKGAVVDPVKKFTRKRTVSEHEEDLPTARSAWQYVEGDWLNMWKERLETKNDDRLPNFKGRRLQTYAGHSSAVRDIFVPDNEHYFLSASRDKTVKLWLLKNHGNGTAQIGCGKTYDRHTKPVFAIQSVESKRLAVSCDGTVHVWDPIKSVTVDQIDLGRNNSIVSIRTLPVPNTAIAMASTEGTIRLYDVRQKSMCDEWKLVSNSAAGSVKCLCVNESGTWIAAGFSSGFLSVLDLRTGILRGQWRAHEAEILQIEAYNDHDFLSTSTDQRMKMWNDDGSLALRLKSPSEPVHCLTICKDSAIWATNNGNRVGITPFIENWANYESKRLPQELFRGTISKLKPLPVNQLYLAGSENGNVVMFD